MSCERWRDRLTQLSLDEMSESSREEYLRHLEGCLPCRRAAAANDPTVVFSLLPGEGVEDQEVEEIQRTVRALRRVREVGPSGSRRGLLIGALAAMILVAVILTPQASRPPAPREVPFAGAVGVGPGLVSVPRTAAAMPFMELEIQLARSARVDHLAQSPALETVVVAKLVARPGEVIERDLSDAYRIRFTLPEAAVSEKPVLRGFELLHLQGSSAVLLLQADLQPQTGSPLILGVNPPGMASEQLWLLVKSSIPSAAGRQPEH